MHETLNDPVCGMEVTYETAQARSDYQGQTYYFCSLVARKLLTKTPKNIQERETHH
jgi:Cu+-exporting ATPase